jgi:hypothetical protein
MSDPFEYDPFNPIVFEEIRRDSVVELQALVVDLLAGADSEYHAHHEYEGDEGRLELSTITTGLHKSEVELSLFSGIDEDPLVSIAFAVDDMPQLRYMGSLSPYNLLASVNAVLGGLRQPTEGWNQNEQYLLDYIGRYAAIMADQDVSWSATEQNADGVSIADLMRMIMADRTIEMSWVKQRQLYFSDGSSWIVKTAEYIGPLELQHPVVSVEIEMQNSSGTDCEVIEIDEDGDAYIGHPAFEDELLDSDVHNYDAIERFRDELGENRLSEQRARTIINVLQQFKSVPDETYDIHDESS